MGLDMGLYKIRKITSEDVAKIRGKMGEELPDTGMFHHMPDLIL